jgi:hypothetical protein
MLTADRIPSSAPTSKNNQTAAARTRRFPTFSSTQFAPVATNAIHKGMKT